MRFDHYMSRKHQTKFPPTNPRTFLHPTIHLECTINSVDLEDRFAKIAIYGATIKRERMRPISAREGRNLNGGRIPAQFHGT